MTNQADLYQQIVASKVGPAPLVIKKIVTTTNAGAVGGMPHGTQRLEHYILLSSLPEELRASIERFISAKIAGM